MEATINIRDQIEAAAAWREAQIRAGKGKQSGYRRVTITELHDNQHPSLAQHLKHDNAHRMLDRFKAAPRNTPVHLGRPVIAHD